MTKNHWPQTPLSNSRYLWKCLTDSRMEWSYRLRLVWSQLKYMTGF